MRTAIITALLANTAFIYGILSVTDMQQAEINTLEKRIERLEILVGIEPQESARP